MRTFSPIGGGTGQKKNKKVWNSNSDIWKPMEGVSIFQNFSISNWEFWFSPKWEIFMKISPKNAKVLTTLPCLIPMLTCTYFKFLTRRVGHCQKYLKFKNVWNWSDRGGGAQAFLGHCPKFSCFLIMTPPLTFALFNLLI